MPHASKNLHNWEFISASVTILFTTRGCCPPYTLSWTACLANKQLSIFSTQRPGGTSLQEQQTYMSVDASQFLKSNVFFRLTFGWLHTTKHIFIVGVCASHLAGFHHIDLLFIHCVLVLFQETLTLVLHLPNDTAKLVLHLGRAGAPLYVATAQHFQPTYWENGPVYKTQHTWRTPLMNGCKGSREGCIMGQVQVNKSQSFTA